MMRSDCKKYSKEGCRITGGINAFCNIMPISFLYSLLFVIFIAFSNPLFPCDLSSEKNRTTKKSFGSTVLVELFTSQGCSSCPPADTVLRRIIERQPIKGVYVIGLGLHVDYWDYLGWRDVFSSSLHTKRQRKYASYFESNRIYTPQMIVGGRYEFVGHDYRKAIQSIRSASREKAQARLGIRFLPVTGNTRDAYKKRVMINVQNYGQNLSYSSLFFAVAEEKLKTKIQRGENSGRHLYYSSVTRYIRNIDSLNLKKREKKSFFQQIQINPSWQKKRLLYVAFLQSEFDGHILASTFCRKNK